MLSVRGIYDGKQIKPLEDFSVPPNVGIGLRDRQLHK